MSRRKPTTGDAIVHALCSPCSPFIADPNPSASMNLADAVLAVAMELGRIADCLEPGPVPTRKSRKGKKP